jgi:hypothetical protein
MIGLLSFTVAYTDGARAEFAFVKDSDIPRELYGTIGGSQTRDQALDAFVRSSFNGYINWLIGTVIPTHDQASDVAAVNWRVMGRIDTHAHGAWADAGGAANIISPDDPAFWMYQIYLDEDIRNFYITDIIPRI